MRCPPPKTARGRRGVSMEGGQKRHWTTADVQCRPRHKHPPRPSKTGHGPEHAHCGTCADALITTSSLFSHSRVGPGTVSAPLDIASTPRVRVLNQRERLHFDSLCCVSSAHTSESAVFGALGGARCPRIHSCAGVQGAPAAPRGEPIMSAVCTEPTRSRISSFIAGYFILLYTTNTL